MALLTTHSEIEELGGGRVRQEISIKRIADYRNGNLYRLLNQIGNTGDPSLPLGVDELVQFRVRDRLAGNSPMAHFGRGQSHIRWTWLNTNNVVGQPSDNVQLFPGAWAGADLRLSIAGHILHDDAPLYTGHPSTFALRLDAHQNFNLDTLSSPEFRILDPILLGPQGQSIPLSWAKSVQGGKTILTVTLPPGDYAGWTLDPTLVLQPDGTDGLDTFLASNNATTNYGTNTQLFIGDGASAEPAAYRCPIKFSVADIPANALISSVTLSSFEDAADDGSGAGSWAVNVHRLMVAFVEAQATWNVRSTGNNWNTAGADGDGTDRVAAVSATVTLDGTAANAFVNWTGATLTADVQGFVNGSLTNNGWLMEAPTIENLGNPATYNRFASSDHATAANRPKLTVVYRLAGGYVPILSRRRL